MHTIKQYAHVFWSMLRADWIGYKKMIIGACIDSAIVNALFIFSAGYIFPSMGMQSSYGLFTAVTLIVGVALFDVWPFVAEFVADITGSKTILNLCTLPIPTWLVFTERACSFATKASCLSITSIFVSKLVLWNTFSLMTLVSLRFVIFFICMQLFIGFFSLIMAALVKDMSRIGMVWVRIVFPLYILGASQFPWLALKSFSPYVAYAMLLNPFVYLMEGMHSIVLGTDTSLPFSLCLGMTILNTIVCAYVGITMLKKRLDLP